MPVVVQMSSTTMLADLDESLRELLQSSLRDHGFDRVDIAFDAPNREWSGQLSAPTLNAFLYDLRESSDNRRRTIDERRGPNGAFDSRPPLVLECSYAITAWTRNVEDEHRLLSQALAILYAFPRLPEEVQPARLRDGSQRFPITTRVGQARGEGKSDFWSAVGGQYKASIDYIVTLTVEPGAALERGPQVRQQVVRVRDRDLPSVGTTELHRTTGLVVDASGEPQPDAWVVLPEVGRHAVTDAAGRFLFDRVPPGTHLCRARTAAGDDGEVQLTIPGAAVDVIIGPAKRAKAAKR